MIGNEDRSIIFRNLKNRLSETLLLVIGLALGIGASAAGFALVLKSMEVSRDLLSSEQYREIIVSTRQSTGDMDVPVMVVDQNQSIILTSRDLRAATDAPDIVFGYIKSPTSFHSTASFMDQVVSSERGKGLLGAGAGSSQASVPDQDRTYSQQQINPLQQSAQTLSTPPKPLDDPEPALSQWPGYVVSPEFFAAYDLHIARGSFFTLEDASLTSNVMVLGSTLARTLYEDGTALGRRFISGPTVYEIIGILEPTGTSFDEMGFSRAFMPDVLQDIHLPNSSMLQSRWNTSLSFMVDDFTSLQMAADQLQTYFTSTYGPNSVVITIPRQEAQALQDRNARIVTMILFLALAGLFIAAVNVSNILLGRAMRKQKTVGILKALGASKQRIFNLFFREALIIGFYASLIGVGISYVLAELMQRTTQFGSIDPLLLVVGIVVAWIITTILTIFPALQASKIPAAEAMRTE
jgi:putative ABC transport system permease protein